MVQNHPEIVYEFSPKLNPEIVNEILHEIVSKIGPAMLKLALSRKRLENFSIANINNPNHYPEQKI